MVSFTGTPRQTVVFVHAHPDDEAIFTGGTLAALSRAGHRTVVVVATSGELGDGGDHHHVRAVRRLEAERSCRILGVDRLVFLDHVDSGLAEDRYERPWGAFVDVDLDHVAAQIADLLVEERADAVVTYDDHGVYGHPDHVHAHHATLAAADLAGVATRYLATVDREYLHFVEAHLVDHAGAAVPDIRPIGSSTVEVTTTVAIHDRIDTKRRAIAAHRSQIGDDPWLGVPNTFDDVYGYEWYVRVGPAGVIDTLATRPEEALALLDDDAPPSLPAADLVDIAAGLAAATRHDPPPPADARRWWRLLGNEHYEAWLIAWPAGGNVSPHDHGGAAAAIAVATGRLTEVRLGTGLVRETTLGPGETRYVPATAVHDVVNRGSEPAVSVHVYSPPLSTMGFYDPDTGRRVRTGEVDPEAPSWWFPHQPAGADAPSPTPPPKR